MKIKGLGGWKNKVSAVLWSNLRISSFLISKAVVCVKPSREQEDVALWFSKVQIQCYNHVSPLDAQVTTLRMQMALNFQLGKSRCN